MRRLIRRARHILRRLAAKPMLDVEGVIEWADRRALRRLPCAAPRSGAQILVAGPGQGSMGDEAMYRAFVQETAGPIVVVARGAGDLLTREDGPRIRYVFLPNLLYGGFGARRRDLAAFQELLTDAASVSIIGADVLDGRYDEAASVRRFRTARLAAAGGVPTRILGFSWNNSPTARARRGMRACGKDVRLLARDECSSRRLRADGAATLETVADLAFLTRPDSDIRDPLLVEWMVRERAAGRGLVIVNANPRLERRFPDQRAQYLALLAAIVDDGCSCILLPHDSRRGPAGEESYLQSIAADAGPNDHVFLIERAPDPGQIAAIVREAALVVSGRMHLVVLSSVTGRATVGIDYQDKFEGLYDLLGYDGRIDPLAAGGPDLVARAREALADAETTMEIVGERRTLIMSRARANLPQPIAGAAAHATPVHASPVSPAGEVLSSASAQAPRSAPAPR